MLRFVSDLQVTFGLVCGQSHFIFVKIVSGGIRVLIPIMSIMYFPNALLRRQSEDGLVQCAHLGGSESPEGCENDINA